MQRVEVTIPDVGDQGLSDFILSAKNIVKIISIHNCTRVFEGKIFESI